MPSTPTTSVSESSVLTAGSSIDVDFVGRLERLSGERPDDVVFADDEGDTTFAQLDRLASRVAGLLFDMGVEPGDRVAIMAGSHTRYVGGVYGIWKAGAILVLLNAQLGPAELRYQLEQSGTTVVLSDAGEMETTVRRALEGVPRSVPIRTLGVHLGRERAAIAVAPDADASISYTSGTTGVPKGAVHTHRSLAVQVHMARLRYSISSTDRVLSLLPVYLLPDLLLGPVVALEAGAWCRIMAKYDPVAFVEHVRRDQITAVGPTVPVLYGDILERYGEAAESVDLSSIRIAGCGGSPIAPETRRAFEERFGFRFVHAYGTTEAPALVTTDPFDQDREFLSVGKPLPHIEVTIEDDTGAMVPANEIGEICFGAARTGAYAGIYEPMRCYWNMPNESAEAFRGGRLRSGDLGYLDDGGFLFISDRLKDMIIRGGMNVYPKELENLLYQDPRVLECAVIGLPHDRYGEVPIAVIRVASASDLRYADAIALVNDHTARFKHLAEVRFVDDFPRNALGKILKRELRAAHQT
jgi:long-chain acyl-CoA synthetase